jgi:hypothetical protein
MSKMTKKGKKAQKIWVFQFFCPTFWTCLKTDAVIWFLPLYVQWAETKKNMPYCDNM